MKEYIHISDKKGKKIMSILLNPEVELAKQIIEDLLKEHDFLKLEGFEGACPLRNFESTFAEILNAYHDTYHNDRFERRANERDLTYTIRRFK